MEYYVTGGIDPYLWHSMGEKQYGHVPTGQDQTWKCKTERVWRVI